MRCIALRSLLIRGFKVVYLCLTLTFIEICMTLYSKRTQLQDALIIAPSLTLNYKILLHI